MAVRQDSCVCIYIRLRSELERMDLSTMDGPCVGDRILSENRRSSLFFGSFFPFSSAGILTYPDDITAFFSTWWHLLYRLDIGCYEENKPLKGYVHRSRIALMHLK